MWDNTTTISEFKVSSNPNLADIGSERKILQEPHPQFNHNGGTVAFGSDGYLYISIGEGGNKNDIGPGHVQGWYAFNTGGNGQDIEKNLMGNILRIDVNATSPGKAYGIPSDNPFIGKTGRAAVEGAWLIKTGTVVAVKWNANMDENRKNEIINAVSTSHNIEPAAGSSTEENNYAKSFPNSNEWFKGKEMDKLSKEEAQIIARNTITGYKKDGLVKPSFKK